ncbi:hypothetical protein O6H91_Y093000 [Diphasiastrum complanatum]|nr:hypothetical protein O6H91_Y093000 [Diphasiastrum complanatum]
MILTIFLILFINKTFKKARATRLDWQLRLYRLEVDVCVSEGPPIRHHRLVDPTPHSSSCLFSKSINFEVVTNFKVFCLAMTCKCFVMISIVYCTMNLIELCMFKFSSRTIQQLYR